jgi:glycosyltransferase involved in cell wall biosynthesis
MEQMNYCVIIPTYNNQRTLVSVIEAVLIQTQNIIIVNDGSTDATAELLEKIKNLEQIHLPKNKGKGNALRHGFRKASALGYTHAITIDSDGQHFAEDIPVFLKAAQEEGRDDVLLIGARNMQQDGVPKKSSFGNKFSNFWFWFETGIDLEDTQSGFRLYPLKSISELSLYTNKFEFEIEVIVKAAWKDVLVKNIPIQVHYDQEDRVSHFRPYKDFTRISILNTYLVIIAIFYIKPRTLIRKVRKIGWKKFIQEDFLGGNDSPRKKAYSVALGILIGLSPFWGFHTVVVIFFAIFLNLNKVIAFTFSNISLPPFIPFVLFASSQVGNFVLGQDTSYSLEELGKNYELLKHLQAYLIGSFILAIVSALVFGFLSYIVFSLIDRKRIAKLG